MGVPGNLIADFYLHAGSLAPNSYQSTIKALSFVERLPRVQKIANIGCGTGLQTVILYEATHQPITAIDFIPEYIQSVEHELKRQNLDRYIHPVLASPDNLPFMNEEYDIIWSEYQASKIGFNYALNEWNKFIKKDGYIVICAYCWLTDNPPTAIIDFWKKNENEIAPVTSRIEQLRKTGFLPVSYFVMPDECRWNHYCPLEDGFESFLKKYPDNPFAQQLIQDIDKEIDLYEKFGRHYGYAFFIGRKTDC